MRWERGMEEEGKSVYPSTKLLSQYGSQLARIESQRENSFVSRLINRPLRSASLVQKTQFWIGMIARRTEDEDALFLWSDGSIVSRYIGFWEIGQPDYKSGTCTRVDAHSLYFIYLFIFLITYIRLI
ncbi:unnamed protein product [Enterobius vermicularis]|uniref:C-type lectin domain-containing protein n=1 Tax=Enterobius vermicularis TaxID=51028 RepID=A0A0N4VRM4_ENTVE|nr:unnamed protein product [Enterobius vermicularis]